MLMGLEQVLQCLSRSLVVTGALLSSPLPAYSSDGTGGGFSSGTGSFSPSSTGASLQVETTAPLVQQENINVGATSFFWHHNPQCVKIPHFEGSYNSNNMSWYAKHYRRLRDLAGVDTIYGIWYGFPNEGIQDMRTLQKAIPIVKKNEMDFAIYYDLSIRMHLSGLLCNPGAGSCDGLASPGAYNFDDQPEVANKFQHDFARIANEIILPSIAKGHPFENAYHFLKDEEGNFLLDEQGGLRPVIAVYIARDIKDNSNYLTVHRVFDAIGEYFQSLEINGKRLGRPAWILDMAFWNREDLENPVAHAKRVSKELANAIPDAIAVTSFTPIIAGMGPVDMAGWVPLLDKFYENTADEISHWPLEQQLSVYPGFSAQFVKDYRICDPLQPTFSFPLDSVKTFKNLVRMAKRRAVVPNRLGAPQAEFIWYEGELYEGTSGTPVGYNLSLLKAMKPIVD